VADNWKAVEANAFPRDVKRVTLLHIGRHIYRPSRPLTGPR
jgi:hypothetical protein